jgi:hypothetical protein
MESPGFEHRWGQEFFLIFSAPVYTSIQAHKVYCRVGSGLFTGIEVVWA